MFLSSVTRLKSTSSHFCFIFRPNVYLCGNGCLLLIGAETSDSQAGWASSVSVVGKCIVVVVVVVLSHSSHFRLYYSFVCLIVYFNAACFYCDSLWNATFNVTASVLFLVLTAAWSEDVHCADHMCARCYCFSLMPLLLIQCYSSSLSLSPCCWSSCFAFVSIFLFCRFRLFFKSFSK